MCESQFPPQQLERCNSSRLGALVFLVRTQASRNTLRFSYTLQLHDTSQIADYLGKLNDSELLTRSRKVRV